MERQKDKRDAEDALARGGGAEERVDGDAAGERDLARLDAHAVLAARQQHARRAAALREHAARRPRPQQPLQLARPHTRLRVRHAQRLHNVPHLHRTHTERHSFFCV